jgi:hypothetical protein
VPEIFQRMDSNWTVEAAKIEVSCAAASYSKRTETEVPDGMGGFTLTSVTVTSNPSMSYTMLALLNDGSFEVVGSFPAPTSSHDTPATGVFDGTSVVQAMWARHLDGVTVGYAVILTTAVASTGTLLDYFEGMRPPNPGVLWFPGDGGCPKQYFPTCDFWNLSWSNPVITGLRIKVAPPDTYDKKDVITEPLPPMD